MAIMVLGKGVAGDNIARIVASVVESAGGPIECAHSREQSFMAESRTRLVKLETVEPIGKRVLLRKDADKKQTKGGIQLPDNIEIPTITGRVIALSAQIQDDSDFPLKQYDKVLFNPKHAIPVEFEGDNQLFVVPIEDIVAVFRKSPESPGRG